MIMQNRLVKPLCALVISCSMISLAAPAFGQQGRNPYFRVQFGPDVERLLHQAENDTSRFVALLEQRERYRLSERAQELEQQLRMVGGEFERRSNFYDRTSNGYDRRSQIASVLRVGGGVHMGNGY